MELILVIDADRRWLNLMEKYLHGHRYRLILTESYQKGFIYSRSGSPNIIFLGFHERFPKSFRTLVDIKKDPISKNIPLISILCSEDQYIIEQSEQLGANDHVMLPADEATIIRKIQTILETDSQAKANEASTRHTHIVVEQPNSCQTMISFKSGLKRFVLPEIRTVFNAEFLNMIMDDEISIDLRDIPHLEIDELLIIEKLISLFRHKTIGLLAGKHLGLILSESDLEEKVNLFMSLDEYETFLQVQKND